jgi:hypothetical protein
MQRLLLFGKTAVRKPKPATKAARLKNERNKSLLPELFSQITSVYIFYIKQAFLLSTGS